MLELQHLTEFDPEKKDYAWIDRMVTHFRQTWKPIADPKRAADGLQFLFGVQDMKEVKAMFSNPDKAGIRFLPLALLEKARNVFACEIQEGGIQIHVKATDPTAFNEKQRDRDLLNNRKIIEAIISKEQTDIGGPPYKLAEDQKNGKPIFSGNIIDFDEMGLDEDSSEDVGYFMKYWHRLNHEIKAEEPINTYFNLSEVPLMLEDWVDDILTKKAVACRTYVSETTGAIEHKYLDPTRVFSIPHQRKDFKDAPVMGYEIHQTVSEFLSAVGSDFDPKTDMQYLLQAVSSHSGINYTGIREDGCITCGDATGLVIDFGTMLGTTIMVGWIEFKTNNALALKKTKKNFHGNPSIRPIPVSKEVSVHSTYEKEVYFNQMTYKAYYLSTGAGQQRLFKAGPLSWQQVEGADDEISGFTISASVRRGPTFVEIARPFVTIWNKSFYKMEFEVNRAKSAGRAYSMENLIKIADAMLPKKDNKNRYDGIMKVLQMFAESPNEIFTYPEVDGQAIGGGGRSSYELPNGLSKTVLDFKAIMDWADSMIKEMVGISPQRDVYQPQARESGRLQDSVTGYSQRATDYIPSMIDRMLINMGNRTLGFVQDILGMKNKSTLAYKHLLRTQGDQTMQELEALGDVAIHRYSIFVEWYNMAQERAEVKAITFQAMQNKEISAEQALLVNSIRSPKRAAEILAMEKRRTELKNAKIVQAQNEAMSGLSAQKHKERMEEIQLEGQYVVQARDAGGRWLFESRKAESAARLEERSMKVDGETQRIRQKVEGDIERMIAESDLEAQQAAPLPTE